MFSGGGISPPPTCGADAGHEEAAPSIMDRFMLMSPTPCSSHLVVFLVLIREIRLSGMFDIQITQKGRATSCWIALLGQT